VAVANLTDDFECRDRADRGCLAQRLRWRLLVCSAVIAVSRSEVEARRPRGSAAFLDATGSRKAALPSGCSRVGYPRRAEVKMAGSALQRGRAANATSLRPVVAAVRLVANHGGFGVRLNSPVSSERGAGRKGP
jgi:hypothetical protein